MPLPAFQNHTFRTMIFVLAAVGAIAAVAGSASLAYRQTRRAAVATMEEKTAQWAGAVGRILDSAHSEIRGLEADASGGTTPRTAASLRRLVAGSTVFREAWIVRGGRVVCTDQGVADEPASVTFAGQAEGFVLAHGRVGEPGPEALTLKLPFGEEGFLGLAIPPQTIAELMRYGDAGNPFALFFLSRDGTVLDRSVNAEAIGSPPPGAPVAGLAENGDAVIFSRPLPGGTLFVSAVLPKSALWELWRKNLPLYAALAALLALCFFSVAWVANARTNSLEYELREAVRLRQIIAHYQPILCLRTGKCEGIEVLMRWQHPKRGLVPPLSFIPEAERTGLITELTECMMIRALDELVPVFRQFPELHAAINIPVQTLTNPSFPSHVDRMIQGRLSYRNLSFELTESTSLTDEALGQLRLMKNLGIRLAVDDFGTGYSNLRYLSLFPFDFLKVDKAFVDGISRESKSSGLVEQIVLIGKSCGMELIAEGIEHQEQVGFLLGLGVEFGQGYFFAKPLPIASLVTWLSEHAALEPLPAPVENNGDGI